PGIEKIAHQHRWVLQLCHFHLLLKLQAPRRRVRYALRGGAVREEIYQSIRNALLLPNGRRLAQTLERLKRLSRGDCGTLRIKTVLCQFLVDLPFYRSYLAHPALGHRTHSPAAHRDLQWAADQQKFLTHPQSVTSNRPTRR